MNILLCVTGFIFCFSSWGMHDANKQNDANKQEAYDTTVSIVSQSVFSGGIFYNWRDEFKKNFYIEENDQRIIEVTLEDKERNDKAILLIANFIKEQKIQEASESLKQHKSETHFNVNTIFTNGKERYTLLSYYLYFLKHHIQRIGANYIDFIHLGCDLLDKSKDQFIVEEQDKKDCYIRRNDPRMRDIIISLITNLQFFTAQHFLLQLEYLYRTYRTTDLHRTFFDYGEIFMYNLGDGQKKYTLCSLYISVLKDTILKDSIMSSINYQNTLVVSTILENFVQPLGEKTYYIRKNDQRIIDIGLYAIDRKFFELEHEFYQRCYGRYLSVYSILKFEDISHAVFSFYYMYIVENVHGKWSFANRARDTLNEVKPYDLVSIYNAKMLEMISYLEENKYHRLARLFLKKYFSNKYLYITGIEYNILSCYSYVLNQMEDIQIENMYAAGESQSIAKPQVAPKDLKDIMIFLEEKKYHALTNALFNEYSSNKVLDASAVFMYDMGDGEKACTPLTLSVFYALKELEKKNKVDKEFENYKAYLADNVYLMSESDPLVKKCIENAEGIRKKSLIPISQNKKQYTLCRGFCKHLYNKMMHYREQHREEIKKQIYNGSAMCVEIMKLILYYQFSY